MADERGTADEPLIWACIPYREPRYADLRHSMHVHAQGRCVWNRYGPRCTNQQENPQ